jgi:hypothetical protein
MQFVLLAPKAYSGFSARITAQKTDRVSNTRLGLCVARNPANSFTVTATYRVIVPCGAPDLELDSVRRQAHDADRANERLT